MKDTIFSTSDSNPLRISVLGLGHVGLPTALGLCSLGWNVIGADENQAKIDLINSGTSPFYEAGLEELLKQHLSDGKFQCTTDVSQAISASTVIFVCVGTP